MGVVECTALALEKNVMVAGMFVVATMSCLGKRLTKVGTGSRLSAIIP